MNGEYLWGSLVGTFWVECIVLGRATGPNYHWVHRPHEVSYRIIFWDCLLKDFVEREVEARVVRFT